MPNSQVHVVVAVTLAIALGSAVLAASQSNECRCRVKTPSDSPFRCSNGERPTGAKQVYAKHYHDERRVFGDCLPEVPAK